MNSRSGGFTLLEIIVAVTITVMILAIVYVSYSTALNSMESIRVRINVYGTVRPVLEQMTHDISCAYFNADDERTAFVGMSDSLDFITLAHRRSSRDDRASDLSEVGFFISEETGTPLLMRRESKYLDDEPLSGGDVSVIADNITAIAFQYYGEEGWTDSWDAVAEEKVEGEEETVETVGGEEEEVPHLPKAVSITVSIADKEGETWVFSTDTTIPLGGEKKKEEEEEEKK
jgi:type II secretion system protein J